MSALSDRMLRVLEVMRQKPDDVHLTDWLARDTGFKRPQVCEALNALHDRSLVEPGRRSVWRLSALGRHPGATYVSPPRPDTSGAPVANLDGTDDSLRLERARKAGLGGLTYESISAETLVAERTIRDVSGRRRSLCEVPALLAWVERQERML